MSKKNNKEVAKQEKFEVGEKLEDWGQNEEFRSRDLFIPKLLTIQKTSDKFADGTAKYGEVRDTLNNKLIGSPDKPFIVIPFLMQKIWVISEGAPGSRPKFKEIIPMTSGNEDLQWETVVGNLRTQRDYTYQFYCLLPDEIKEGTSTPYILPLSRSNRGSGSKMASVMYMRNKKAGIPPAGMAIEISLKEKTNDDGSWYTNLIKVDRSTTAVELKEAFEWFNTVKASDVKIDNSDLEKGESGEATREAPKPGEF